MNYRNLEAMAKQTLERTTPLEMARNLSIERNTVDEDFHLANESDEALKGLASSMRDVYDLPLERLVIMETDAMSMRADAREKVQWCRHFSLQQDTTHTQSPITMFADPISYSVGCNKLEIPGAQGSFDYEAAIASYKSNVCKLCPFRSPKRETA